MDPMGYQEPPKMKMLPEKGTIVKRKQPSSSSPIIFQGYRWWKKSGDHQLRLVVSPIINKVLYMPGGDRRMSEPGGVTAPMALRV